MSKSRLPLIEELFILRVEKGFTERMIKEYLMSPPYQYGLRNVQIYLRYLRKYIDENVNIDRDELIKKQKEYLETRMNEFHRHGQDKMWMETMKEYNKLLGLYEAQKVDLTSGGNTIIPQVIYLNLPPDDGVKN
jgi:hypothetical protein